MTKAMRWGCLGLSLALVACGEETEESPTRPPAGGADPLDGGAPTFDAAAPSDAEQRAEGGAFPDAAPAPFDVGPRVDVAPPADASPPDAAPPVPDARPAPGPYPEPGAWPPNRGPGGPRRAFLPEALGTNCAYLDGGAGDTSDHHNLVVMYDGYLLMPWSPEFGLTGGLTFWDITDPCTPVVAGYGTTDLMRETHAIGFSTMGGRWAVTNHQEALVRGGVLFWDVSDTRTPTVVSSLKFDGFFYPDAYARVVLSVFWQAPYVYVATADNGIYIVDASDPRNPTLVGQYIFEPVLRAGQVHAVGNLLITTAAEGTRAALLDISNPAAPRPIPGGDFVLRTGAGEAKEIYFSNIGNGYLYGARKQGGGGVMVYDIRDPGAPTYVTDIVSNGNGGYVFVKDQFAFTGESDFAVQYDLSDLANPVEVRRFNLEGDLDTATPIGNVLVLSADDKAERDQGSAIAPWAAEPDTTPPRVTWVYPSDGATGLALTSRFGLSFNEMVDPGSAWVGSIRLYRADLSPDEGRVDGYVSAQENIVNFWPAEPLAPNTQYTLEVPAGGIVDFNGNPIAEPFTATFTTGL